MATFLWVIFGGAIGTGARFGLSGWAAHRWGETFPWGTIVINITGCFIISLFAGLTGPDGRWIVNTTGRQFFLVGICGGYTTFSSYSFQTLTLARDGEWLLAAANVIGSNISCLIAVWLGFLVASLINNSGRA